MGNDYFVGVRSDHEYLRNKRLGVHLTALLVAMLMLTVVIGLSAYGLFVKTGVDWILPTSVVLFPLGCLFLGMCTSTLMKLVAARKAGIPAPDKKTTLSLIEELSSVGDGALRRELLALYKQQGEFISEEQYAYFKDACLREIQNADELHAAQELRALTGDTVMTRNIQTITESYSRDRGKPSIQAVLRIARAGRKYGFPIANTISTQSEQQQIRAAACLLLAIDDTWPLDDVPADFAPEAGSALLQDAVLLLSNAHRVRPLSREDVQCSSYEAESVDQDSNSG